MTEARPAELDGDVFCIADAAAVIAALDLDLAERAAAFAEAVKKGRMNEAEADHVTRLLGDIRADLLFAFAPVAWRMNVCDGGIERPSPDFTWNDKVAWIRGEVAALEGLPEALRKGRITEENAARRTMTASLLRRLYWKELFMWDPPEGPARDYVFALRHAAHSGAKSALGAIQAGEGRKIYQEHVRKHLAMVELEEQDGQGRLVA